MTPHDDKPSDQLIYKLIGLIVATAGHGLYLAYKYVRDGHVNDISVGLLIFLTAVTIVVTIVVLIMRRSEARERDDWRSSG